MPSLPSLDKCPSLYGAYRTTLSPTFLAKAKDELHENDATRDPSMAQMREFIAKHPQIQRCRTDALFLLRFLRARKFNVTAACEMLENYLICFDRWPQCVRFSDSVDLYSKLIDGAFLVPLGYAPEGQFVMLYRPAGIELRWMGTEHVFKLGSALIECYLEEEQFQVCGLEIICDFQGATLAYFGMWTVMDLKLLMDSTTGAMPLRTKRVHICGLPRFGSVVINTCLAMAPLKHQQKVKVGTV